MTIPDLQIVPLRTIPDARGSVMHMLRKDAPHFKSFGEVYFSTVRRGTVKGWKRHHAMTLNIAVPVGFVRFAAFDDRAGSESKGGLVDVSLGPDNYKLLVIPPGIWTAFQGVANGESLVVNCASILHGAEQVDTREINDPPVAIDWTLA